jgi:hypothetical protein
MRRRDREITRVGTLIAVASAAIVGCSGGTPVAPVTGPLRLQVENMLLAPVIVSVDGVPIVILASGAHSEIGVARSAQLLTWTSAKPTDASGRQIPDDIGQIRIPVGGLGTALEIDNVIDGLPHFTASITNHTTAIVSIGVFDGTTVSCAGVLPELNDLGPGFVQIGYYRLGPATEVRAYHDSAHCTGPFTAWPRSLLAAFTPRSGAVRLSLDTAP